MPFTSFRAARLLLKDDPFRTLPDSQAASIGRGALVLDRERLDIVL